MKCLSKFLYFLWVIVWYTSDNISQTSSPCTVLLVPSEVPYKCSVCCADQSVCCADQSGAGAGAYRAKISFLFRDKLSSKMAPRSSELFHLVSFYILTEADFFCRMRVISPWFLYSLPWWAKPADFVSEAGHQGTGETVASNMSPEEPSTSSTKSFAV
jgi:hypothetical protein